MAHNDATVGPSGGWYSNFQSSCRTQADLDFQEDLFQPFVLRFDFNDAPIATVIASTHPRNAADTHPLCGNRNGSAAQDRGCSASREPLVKALVAAADHYVVQRGNLKTIVAGYHWFSDWGRDSMIALPGLTLATGR